MTVEVSYNCFNVVFYDASVNHLMYLANEREIFDYFEQRHVISNNVFGSLTREDRDKIDATL